MDGVGSTGTPSVFRALFVAAHENDPATLTAVDDNGCFDRTALVVFAPNPPACRARQ